MIFKKKFGLILSIILLFAFAVNADIGITRSEPSYPLNLNLETKENLSDYRFFLDFYGDLREIKVNDNSQTIIPPIGDWNRGSGRRFEKGLLLAIPRKNLTEFAEDSPDKLKALSEAIEKKKIEGVIELTRHSFYGDSILGTKPQNPSYIIVREAGTLKAIQSSDLNSNSNDGQISPNYLSGIIIIGIFFALAALILGIFLFRKASKKV